MKIELKEHINTGFQKINRLKFTGENGRSVHVDLYGDELKEVVETINQFIGFEEV